MTTRDKTRRLNVGNVPLGGGAQVSIQSMTNTPPHDEAKCLSQVKRLAEAGCDIVRLTVPDLEAAEVFGRVAAQSPVPLVADVHFDHRLALAAVKNGASAVRINPGNIDGGEAGVRAVAEAAGERGIPIRIGANSGSLVKGLLEKKISSGMAPEDALAEALVDSALTQVKMLEKFGFFSVAVSIKASSAPATVKAYRLFAERSDCPLHLGVTEAGTPWRGTIKSAVGIGALLLDGIGDTIRVSLTGDPVEEVRAGRAILECAGIRDAMPEIVSCPTCGRTKYDLEGMAVKVENLVGELKKSGKIKKIKKLAVMGCVVNGPGEARDADIGIAGGGDGRVVVFKFGKTVSVMTEDEAFAYLRRELTQE